MKKILVAAVAAASLSGGAAAYAVFSPIGIASAQDSGQQQSAPDTTTQTPPKTKPARRAAVRQRIKQRVTGTNERAHWLSGHADESFVEGNTFIPLQNRLSASDLPISVADDRWQEMRVL